MSLVLQAAGLGVALALLAGGGHGESSKAQARGIHDGKLEKGEPTANLYAISPFLHGYRDGYGYGFHDADLERHFARPTSQPEASKAYKNVVYRSEWGDRKSYVEGYRAGFRRGYHDLMDGRDWRGFKLLQQAEGSGGLGLVAKPSLFNAGAMDGYLHGTSGEAARKGGKAHAEGCQEGARDPYCAGFKVGDRLVKAESAPVADTNQ